jgi:hypothetical protein
MLAPMPPGMMVRLAARQALPAMTPQSRTTGMMMESNAFDALSKSVAGLSSRRSAGQTLIGLALGAGLAPWLGLPRPAEARRKKNKKRKCGNCKGDRYCEKGKCTPCKPLDAPCQADVQCSSGICDRYSDTCTEVRFACNPNKPNQCANNGSCCDFGGDGEFFCADDLTSNRGACGTSCENIVNCRNEGDDTACVNAKCCCTGPNCSPTLPPC